MAHNKIICKYKDNQGYNATKFVQFLVFCQQL